MLRFPHAPRVPCIASGGTQALLMRLLASRVGAIVGEEDEAAISIDGDGPFRAGEIMAPAALEPLIINLRARMDALAAAVPASAELSALTAFIDPIDGTKEFCSGLGEQCSICVGLADAAGAAVGGIVYRPLCAQRSWALGCAREGVCRGALRDLSAPASAEGATGGAFLASNSGKSAFLQALEAELGLTPYPAGGAGNKALLVLELAGAVYIQDRGVSRWDTCAAQAVVEAHGGLLTRLDGLTAEGAPDAPFDPTALARYTYIKGPTNSAFVSGLPKLTRYNAAAGVEVGDRGTAAEQFKAYANLCGLFALSADADAAAIARAVKKVAKATPPSYD